MGRARLFGLGLLMVLVKSFMRLIIEADSYHFGKVIMKYIDNPLLICSQNFDRRQWVLIKDWNQLTVLAYAECYSRFAAKITNHRRSLMVVLAFNWTFASIKPCQFR